MSLATQPHADISTDIDGTKHAISAMHQVTVMPDGDTELFNRNAIKNALGANSHHERWIVARLDDVRVYVNGSHIVITKQDMYP